MNKYAITNDTLKELGLGRDEVRKMIETTISARVDDMLSNDTTLKRIVTMVLSKNPGVKSNICDSVKKELLKRMGI